MPQSDQLKNRIFWLLMVTTTLLFSCGFWIYFALVVPNLQLAEFDSTNKDPEYIAHMRTVSHKVIGSWIGNHHDAFLVLEQVGNHESIPYLIRALKMQQNADSDGVVICTAEHCVDCLQRLTGMNFGYEPDDWQKWWEEEGVKLSAAELAKRAAASLPAELY